MAADEASCADPGGRAGPGDPPNRISGELTLALAGDCIPTRPIGQLEARLPAFAAVLDLLRGADVSCGNLETVIADVAGFGGHPYSWDGDWPLLAEPAVAADLASMGFDVFARANNHALDWGLEGMRETTGWLDAAGLAHSGAGERLGLARRAGFHETPQGRIGLVSVATTFRPTTEAMAERGTAPGRPGVSGLRLRRIDIVTFDELALLRRFEDQPQRSGDQVCAFGRTFEAGSARGCRHEMDPADLSDLLKSIRQGRQSADLLVLAVHAHETGRDGYPEPPSGFLKLLAEAAIDAGADVVAVSGLHHVGPVDLVRGRPVFYGLGNFIWSDLQESVPAELFELNRDLLAKAFERPERATAADLNQAMNADYFTQPEVFEGILPIVRFDGPRLAEVVIHPVDLGQHDPLTLRGVPRLATGEQADRILSRIRDASAAFGCGHEMEIVEGRGFLRPGPQ